MRNWYLEGYNDFPLTVNWPTPETPAEKQYLRGWNAAQRAQTVCDDCEWEFGRETFFADYH